MLISSLFRSLFKRLVRSVTPIVEKFGGTYIARGGKSENVEGKWPFERTVVVKFPSYEVVQKWHKSDEYKPIKKIREDNAECNAIIIEGID